MSAPACMGGWCTKRNGCSLYLTDDRQEPAERLCMKGFDGVGAEFPVRIHKPAGSWERGAGGLLATSDAMPS
jgi:hypothetical protein